VSRARRLQLLAADLTALAPGATVPSEIRRIIDLQRQGAQPCGTVIRLLEHHLEDINRTMRDLRALRNDLSRALEAARSTARRGEDVAICPIIEHASDKIVVAGRGRPTRQRRVG